MVLACGSSPEKAVRTWRKFPVEVFTISVYKQPTTYCIKTTTVSSSDIHAHPRPVIPSFGSNRGQVTRKQYQSWFKHKCLAARHLNFERALDKCEHIAHYKELTETGNRASKVFGIQVSDCLTAWSVWPRICVRTAKYSSQVSDVKKK